MGPCLNKILVTWTMFEWCGLNDRAPSHCSMSAFAHSCMLDGSDSFLDFPPVVFSQGEGGSGGGGAGCGNGE